MTSVFKRIVAVGLGTHAEERRVILLLDSAGALISKRGGLDEVSAELFAEGVLEGLRIAAQGYVLREADPLEQAAGNWNLEDYTRH